MRDRAGERLRHRIIGDVTPATGVRVDRAPETRTVVAEHTLEVVVTLVGRHL